MSRSRQQGYSFLEIVVVMGAMAMLLGLAVGFIGNIGQATFLVQAKGMLSETAYRCLGSSNGGRRAIFMLRKARDEDGIEVLRLGAAVARPVLTHQFETIDFASEARAPVVHGNVEHVQVGGHVGNCAKFASGSYLEFTPQAIFAMTEGIELDVWVNPEPRQRLMSLVRGDESYEVMLVQDGESDGYNVRLSLKLRRVGDDLRDAPLRKTFDTKGAPLTADGRWSRVEVRFDGLDASIRVNGLECYEPETKGRRPGGALHEELAQLQRIVVPARGAVAVTISSGDRPYTGRMDGFRLLGVFRSEELERDLPGDLEVMFPKLPLRIVFANGMLDPDVHSGDQIIRLRDKRSPDDPPIRLTLGMYGTISSVYETPGQGGPDARSPRVRGKSNPQDAAKGKKSK